MANTGLKSKAKAKQHIQVINSKLKNISRSMTELKKNIDLLQGTSGDNCLWNGALAKKYYSKAKINYEAITKNYNAALSTLSEIAVKVAQLSSTDK